MTDAAIHMSGVTKRFGTKTVLNDLNYSLRKGSVTGLLGKNGSGKTTLLKCALGLISPQEGECFLLSEPALQLSADAKARLGYESLRPTTRQQWVQENALAIAIDTLQIQGVWLVVQAGVLVCFLGRFWNSPAIPNVVLFLMGAHVLMFGVSAWTASLGSTVWTMVSLCIVVGFLQPAWFGISRSAAIFGWTIPAIAAGCGLTGCALMVFAYRRWCRMDLN